MNQKQVKNLFKDSEKKEISKFQLPLAIQKKLTNDSYTLVQEAVQLLFSYGDSSIEEDCHQSGFW